MLMLRVALVVLILATVFPAVYFWTGPVYQVYDAVPPDQPLGEPRGATVWDVSDRWLPVALAPLALMAVVGAGAWSAYRVWTRPRPGWWVLLGATVLLLWAGVALLMFSLGPLFLPAAVILTVLAVYSGLRRLVLPPQP